MLKADHIHLSYGEKKILQGLSFTIHSHEILAFIGVSGSGKTTLFKIIAGLIQPDKGSLVWQDKAQVTYMQQEDLLLPWRTVLDNLLLFTELGEKNRRQEYKEKAFHLLEKVGLQGTEELFPHQLSGGMRQRLTLARALLQERALLLLDEPFGSLDLLLREELYQLLLKIRECEKKTMILVTHDFRDALSIADRILILQNGKIKESFCLDKKRRGDPLYENALSTQIRLSLL